jgi:hypothetical protein
VTPTFGALVDKTDFEPHTQYTVTLRTSAGLVRPANFYVHRVHNEFMIARLNGDGTMHKLAYADILKVVSMTPVPHERRYHVPPQLLEEQLWRGRSTMQHYASAPRSGK